VGAICAQSRISRQKATFYAVLIALSVLPFILR
jgi:hypothetical protein